MESSDQTPSTGTDSGSEQNDQKSMVVASNGWNKKNKQLCRTWMMQAAGMEKSYYVMLRRTILINRLMMVTYILLSTIGGGMAFFNLGTDTDAIQHEYGIYISTTIGCISLVAAGIAGLNGYLKLEMQIAAYKYAAGKFSRLVRKIESTLAANPKDRPPCKHFLQSISEKYAKYQNSGEVMEMMDFSNLEKKIKHADRIFVTANAIGNVETSEEDIELQDIAVPRLGILDKMYQYTDDVQLIQDHLDDSVKDIENISFV